MGNQVPPDLACKGAQDGLATLGGSDAAGIGSYSICESGETASGSVDVLTPFFDFREKNRPAISGLPARGRVGRARPRRGGRVAGAGGSGVWLPPAGRRGRTLVVLLSDLLAESERGRRLVDGLHVVIVGAPNAGKSSLLNALAGSERAIVTEVPGTTRDLLREVVRIDGIELTLVDTAGLRDAGDAIEAEGMRRARNELAHADLAQTRLATVWVVDTEGGDAPAAGNADGNAAGSASKAGAGWCKVAV